MKSLILSALALYLCLLSSAAFAEPRGVTRSADPRGVTRTADPLAAARCGEHSGYGNTK